MERPAVWSFETEPEFQAKLDWTRLFVREQVEPLDLLFPDRAFDPMPAALHKHVTSLKRQVREQGLWACHLGPELGGQGYGAVKLALLNEILGTSQGEHNLGWGPIVFGTQAPDTGNAEIIAHYGTQAQKDRYLRPLLEGEVFSSFSMTEPQGGADPGVFTASAYRDGDEWVINGEKWFTSNSPYASLFIVMAMTQAGQDVHRGASMFLVPAETPGIEIIRNVASAAHENALGTHGYIRYNAVRVPADHLLGAEGEGFAVAQTRLAGGRLHHAMRTVARCRQALDMMSERALSRVTKGSVLADKQLVQQAIADSYLDLEQFRLFVLRTAWICDTQGGAAARKDIAACKVLAARVMKDIVGRAIHLHGSLGMSNELPLALMWLQAPWMGVMDGPTEVHLITVARQHLKGYRPSDGLWPSAHLPSRRAAARQQLAGLLAEIEGR
jgi:acyl-CoA dehydrogenase